MDVVLTLHSNVCRCYIAGNAISRSASAPEIEARAVELERTTVLADRPAGSVVSVAVATYVCKKCGSPSLPPTPQR